MCQISLDIKNRSVLGLAMVMVLTMLLPAVDLEAQYFGRNKPGYSSFSFDVQQTPHFEIYHYLKGSPLLKTLSEWSEEWYGIHQTQFSDTFKTRNPVIFYNTQADFQQTNAVASLIGNGTGGVTESLKNRVIMPVAPTLAQTDHTLGHELVHAFQYRLFLNRDSASKASVNNIPLWMIEGMAEYFSLGSVDPNTAMWMRDALINNDFPTLKQLSTDYRYFPYRYGQAFMAFAGKTWGDSLLVPLLFKTGEMGFSKAADSILGYGEKTLSGMWKSATELYYGRYINERRDTLTGTALITRANGGRMNISPAISPDGKKIAFFSEKDVFNLDLYIADAASGRVLRKISGVTKRNVDDFNYIESSGTWSPDSRQFAFVIFSRGSNKLAVVDAGKGRIINEITIRDVPAIYNPSWSADGSRIAFSGMADGVTDLYLYDFVSGKTERLTSDQEANIHPSWSPDGRYLVYSQERTGNRANGRKYSYSIALLDLADKSVRELPLFEGAYNMNPLFSPDGNSLYFLSDADGFRNLYRYDLGSEKLYRLTDYLTGISGITPWSPAITISSKASATGNGSAAGPVSGSADSSAVGPVVISAAGSGAGPTVISADGSDFGSAAGPDFGSSSGSAVGPVVISADGSDFGSAAGPDLISAAGPVSGFADSSAVGPTVISADGSDFGSSSGSAVGPVVISADGSDFGSADTAASSVVAVFPSATSATGIIAYNYYTAGSYQIITADAGQFTAVECDPDYLDFGPGMLPPGSHLADNRVDTILYNRKVEVPLPADSVKSTDYKAKFKLDYLSNNTNVGVSTGGIYRNNLGGSVIALFSDMVGDNQLFTSLALNGEIYDFGGQAAYINQKGKIKWGTALSHIPYMAGSMSIGSDSINYKDAMIPVDVLQLNYLRMFEDNVTLYAAWPFSQTRRLESTISASWYYYRIDQYNYYYLLNGVSVGGTREKLPAPKGSSYRQVSLAWVEDNSFSGVAAPLQGHRARFQIDKYFGATNIFTGLADYRKYFWMKPVGLAVRAYSYGLYGAGSETDVLQPLYLGYPWLIRGYERAAYGRQDPNSAGSFDISRLSGTRMAVANAELRLPLSGPEQLSLISSRYLLTDLNLFVDAGLAWNRGDKVVSWESEALTGTDERYPLVSTGISLRINLLGYLVLEPYYAFPLQNGGFKNGVFGLNFLPGW